MNHRHGPAGASVLALAFFYLIYLGLETICLSPVRRWSVLRWLITSLAGCAILMIFALLSARDSSGMGMLLSPHARQGHCLVNDQIKALWRL